MATQLLALLGAWRVTKQAGWRKRDTTLRELNSARQAAGAESGAGVKIRGSA